MSRWEAGQAELPQGAATGALGVGIEDRRAAAVGADPELAAAVRRPAQASAWTVGLGRPPALPVAHRAVAQR